MSPQTPEWVPEGADLSRPNAARVYDYLLGGTANFAVDREFVKRLMVLAPDAPALARRNRDFLRRAVRYLAGQGIRQFLDLGSGIPTGGNVHEIAQRAAPDARVVYVDNEAVAVAYSRQLLAGNPDAAIVATDLRDPAAVLAHPDTRRLLDLSQPVAVLLFAVLHFMPDTENPTAVIARYRDAMPPGSYLALSHGTLDNRDVANIEFTRQYRQSASHPLIGRTHAEVLRLFDGLTLVEPGVVFAPQWRPDSPLDESEDPTTSGVYAGIGYKPG